MRFKILYSEKALRDLRKLGHIVAKDIDRKIEFYVKSGHPLKYAKKLEPPLDNFYRFRVGEYRVIFMIDSKGGALLLTILKIGHRREVYE